MEKETNKADTRAERQAATDVTSRPLAIAGLTSYRCKSGYGWVMIGAVSPDDALNEARRSCSTATAEDIEVCDGTGYRPVVPTPLSTKTVKHIEQLTAINDHGGALAAMAAALAREDFIDRIQSINRRHLTLGHLPAALYEERREVRNEMLAFARTRLSTEDVQRLYAACEHMANIN